MNDSDDIELVHTTPQVRNRHTGSWINQEDVSEVQRFNQFRTIDWVEDELDEQRQRLHKVKAMNTTGSLKQKVYSVTQNWLLLAFMGVVIGSIASSLNIITSWLANIRFGHCSHAFYLSKASCCWGQDEAKCTTWVKWTNFEIVNYFIYIFISLFLSFTAAILVKVYATAAAGSGIAEIKCIVNGFVMDGFLGWWTLIIKSLGLPLVIASGLSVGKEGPSVHYAVCVGNSLAKFVNKYRKSAAKGREFLTATAGAGVAVAFGSPMGGVLFLIEEISAGFQLSTLWKTYFCSMIAVLTLAAFNPFRTGQLVMFEVSYDTNWKYFEIPFYIIVGVFGGVYGIVVAKFNIRAVAFRKKYLSNFAVREVVLLTLLTVSFSYFNEFLRLEMTELMQILFHECDDKFSHHLCDPNSNKIPILTSLIFATIARMGLTIISYGCKVPAGIFVPSMAAGATFGRALGLIFDLIYQHNKQRFPFSSCLENEKCIIPGTYAFLGAAAALSGITHMTVSVVIIMFELTGALRYIIPTMIVVSITKMINDRWGKGGIADQMIHFNGLPHIDPQEDYVFNTNVESAMTSLIITISTDHNERMKLSQLKTMLQKSKHRGYPIIQSTNNPRIVGFVSRTELLIYLRNYQGRMDSDECNFDVNYNGDEKADFKRIIIISPLTINISTSLEYVLDIFIRLGPRYILVEKDGILVGLITRKDVLRYEHTLHSLDKDSSIQRMNEIFDAKVWEIMNHFYNEAKMNLGRLLHNDETRYL